MNFIKYLKERGYDEENLGKHMQELYASIYPEFGKLHHRIIEMAGSEIMKEGFDFSDQNHDSNNLQDFTDDLIKSIRGMKSGYYHVSKLIDKRLFNNPSVVSAFLDRSSDANFTFVIGRDQENSITGLFTDFIVPNLGKSVKLYVHRDDNGPEFNGHIIDDKSVVFFYPYFEFETLRSRFKLDNPSVAQEIKRFYEDKIVPVKSADSLDAIFLLKDSWDDKPYKEAFESLGILMLM